VVTTIMLSDDQLVRLADLVADRLAASVAAAPGQLVDAQALATMLGTSRDCVYRHAVELGAQRIGDGQRGRLRFDPAVALERWNIKPASTPTRAAPTTRRRPPSSTGVALLPIRGER
jgi:hypothetical protein